jgi:hypothetical protein
MSVMRSRLPHLDGTPHGLRHRPHDTAEVDRLLAGPIATNELLSVGMAIEGHIAVDWLWNDLKNLEWVSGLKPPDKTA